MLSAFSSASTPNSSSASSASSPKKYVYLVLTFLAVATLSVLANGVKNKLDVNGNNDREMINKYLLGDSPLDSLGGDLKPKLWIHTKYERNARRWESFQSRSNTNLNQPYINLTVETIVNHCAHDFHICLIDDESFASLLPDWKLKKNQMACLPDPKKSQYRQEGLLQLLYKYGGIIVPNSFVAFNNLIDLHVQMTQTGRPFMVEMVANNQVANQPVKPSSSASLSASHSSPLFAPSTAFMGAPKQNETVLEMIAFSQALAKDQQLDFYIDFWGRWNNWCRHLVHDIRSVTLVDGKSIGVKTKKGTPVLIEHLFQESYLPLANTPDTSSPSFYGVYIPADQILQRVKYQWFSVLSKEEVYACRAVVAKYILAALVETSSVYQKNMQTNTGI